MSKIGIIDYGSGNFASVWYAVTSLTKDVYRVTKPDEFDICSHLILPGVGAFGSAMDKISSLGIKDRILEDVVQRKKHFLGICVGMQVLASEGHEFQNSAGLNLVPGKVVKLNVDENRFPLPHIGWNNIMNRFNSPLFNGITDEDCFYFVHSFHLQPDNLDDTFALTFYGRKFVAALSKENIYGVQFHPEKSQAAGLRLLSNFCQL